MRKKKMIARIFWMCGIDVKSLEEEEKRGGVYGVPGAKLAQMRQTV